MVNIQNLKKKIFYRATFQGVQYQSQLYCRMTKRNNFTVLYDTNKVAFIEYFLEVDLVTEKICYAVVRDLYPEENSTISANFEFQSIKKHFELTHITRYQKRR